MAFTLGMILDARERLKGVAQRTGLVQFKALSDENSQIYLKTEDLQNTGSFKVRGAYIKIASLTEEERACGVIASSAGNHAQGVALAARAFGVPATIVMPAGAPLSKVKATRELGANVVLHGSVYDDAYAEACVFRRKPARRLSIRLTTRWSSRDRERSAWKSWMICRMWTPLSCRLAAADWLPALRRRSKCCIRM